MHRQHMSRTHRGTKPFLSQTLEHYFPLTNICFSTLCVHVSAWNGREIPHIYSCCLSCPPLDSLHFHPSSIHSASCNPRFCCCLVWFVRSASISLPELLSAGSKKTPFESEHPLQPLSWTSLQSPKTDGGGARVPGSFEALVWLHLLRKVFLFKQYHFISEHMYKSTKIT